MQTIRLANGVVPGLCRGRRVEGGMNGRADAGRCACQHPHEACCTAHRQPVRPTQHPPSQRRLQRPRRCPAWCRWRRWCRWQPARRRGWPHHRRWQRQTRARRSCQCLHRGKGPRAWYVSGLEAPCQHTLPAQQRLEYRQAVVTHLRLTRRQTQQTQRRRCRWQCPGRQQRPAAACRKEREGTTSEGRACHRPGGWGGRGRWTIQTGRRLPLAGAALQPSGPCEQQAGLESSRQARKRMGGARRAVRTWPRRPGGQRLPPRAAAGGAGGGPSWGCGAGGGREKRQGEGKNSKQCGCGRWGRLNAPPGPPAWGMLRCAQRAMRPPQPSPDSCQPPPPSQPTSGRIGSAALWQTCLLHPVRVQAGLAALWAAPSRGKGPSPDSCQPLLPQGVPTAAALSRFYAHDINLRQHAAKRPEKP